VSSAKPHIRRAAGVAVVGLILAFMPTDASAQHALAAQTPCSGENPQATFDQYCESIPTTTGERGSSDDPGDSRPPPVQAIPGATAHRLRGAPLGPAIVQNATVDARGSGDAGARKRNRGSGRPESGVRSGTTPQRVAPRTERQSGGFGPGAALGGVPVGLIALVVAMLGIAAATSLRRARGGRLP
jgi:hypothetical protein